MAALTTVINLFSMAAALWLGLYIITRSPHSAPSRLAALLLWALATHFLCTALLRNVPGNAFVAWLQQVAIFALPLMLHLSVRLRPAQARLPAQRGLAATNRVAVPLAYAIAAVMSALGVRPSSPPVGLLRASPLSIPESAGNGLLSGTAGLLYLLFLVFLVLVSSLSLINLWHWRRLTRRRSVGQPYTAFFGAGVLAGLGTVYTGVGIWMRLDLPSFPADVLTGVGVVLVGYAVARYAALLEGRPMDRDFQYAVLLVGSLTAFYLFVATVLYIGGQVSFVTLVLTIVGAVAANSLFDGARIALDRVFYQRQFQNLRGNLRALAGEIGTGGTLSQRLQAILAALCRTLQIRKGFVALPRDGQWVVEATCAATPPGTTFAAQVLEGGDSIGLLHPDEKGLPGMVLVLPLHAGGSQIGALVLGGKESRQPYTEADLELLEDLADEMADLIHGISLQETNAQAIDAMVRDFREKEHLLQLQLQEMLVARAEESRRLPAGAGEELLPDVEDALRRLHDFAYLGEHPLARLRAVEQRLHLHKETPVTFIERGKALSEVLLQALNQLRPSGVAPGRHDVPPREWFQFIILHDSYVLDEPTRNTMSRLYIGEGTFNRTRRRALGALAKSLAETELTLAQEV